MPIERLLSGSKHGNDWGTRPDDLDPTCVVETLDKIGRLFGPGRYFRLDARGYEHVPDAPALLVSNHSGGTSIPDAWGLVTSWYRQFGIQRPMHILAHDMILSNAITGAYFARRGVLRARRDLAVQALREWRRDVLVMPGGEMETWRPYSKRYELCFGERKGYAWLALKAGVSIVPIAHAGAHETLMVLTDGRRIARALRMPFIARSSVFPVHISLPWGLTVGPWPHIPIPTTLRYRIGAPIPPIPIDPDAEPTPEQVAAHDAEVRTAIQHLLDELKAEAARRRRELGPRAPTRALHPCGV